MNNLPEAVGRATDLIKRAVEHEEAGRYVGAISSYQSGIGHFELILKNKQNEHLRPVLQTKLASYRQRLEELIALVEAQRQCELVDGAAVGSSDVSQRQSNHNRRGDEEQQSSSLFEERRIKNPPRVTWDDIVGLDETKQLLWEALFLREELGHLMVGMRKPTGTMLLYGPPGNGKTELARALANAARQQCSFYAITGSDIISKFVGDSERNVRELFDTLRRAKPAILFLDEIDALCGKRPETSGGGGGGSRGGGGGGSGQTKALQEFLQQLDGLCDENLDDVLVLGATNLPWALDTAILRRFAQRIYIPMPNRAAREQILTRCLTKNAHAISPQQLYLLAQQTEHYSASDLTKLVADAAMRPIRRLRACTRFHIVTPLPSGGGGAVNQRQQILPCPCLDLDAPVCSSSSSSSSTGDVLCVLYGYADLQDKRLLTEPPILFTDMEQALAQIKPSVGVEHIRDLEEWTHKYGHA